MNVSSPPSMLTELLLDASRVLSECSSILRSHDLRLSVGDDFHEYMRLSDGTDKPPGSAFFDPMLHDFLPDRGFWVCGRLDDGSLQLAQAMRLDDLGDSTLYDLWRNQLPRMFGTEYVPTRDFTPILNRVTGRVVYHGDLWLHVDLRKMKLGEICARFAMALAVIKWRPDWFVGLQEDRVAKSGFGLREGYFNWAPIGAEWRWGEPFLKPDDWIGWMTPEDTRRMFRTYHPQIE